MNLFLHKIVLVTAFLSMAVLPAGAESRPQRFAEGAGGALLCRDGYLYAALQNKLCIYDVSSPREPKPLSAIPAAGKRQFALAGKTLYLSCRTRGVQIFDVSDPQKPKEINRFYPVELATGLTVSDQVLGVAQRIYGVELFDVSDPLHPRSMGLLKTGEAQSAAFFGKGKIAVGDWGNSKAVIGDVSDPAHPRIISSIGLEGYGDGAAVRGKYLFAATGHKKKNSKSGGHGLEIFDISDLRKPVRTGSVRFPSERESVPDWWQVLLCGNTAFVADSWNGVYAIDITHPDAPKIKKHWRLSRDAVSRIAAAKGVLYLSGHKTGLYLVPCPDAVSSVPEPAEVKPVPPGKVPECAGLRGFSVPGFVWSLTAADHLYASCGQAGLREFRVEPDGTLAFDKVWQGVCFDCKISSNLLFLAKDDFLEIIDRKTGRLLSRTPARPGQPFFQLHLYQAGKLLVSSGRTSMLLFWDVSHPERPEFICRCSGRGLLYDDMLPETDINGFFPVNWHAGNPVWYQAAKRPAPVYCSLGKLQRVSDQRCGVTACGGKFLLFARQGKVLLLDPAAPEKYEFLPVKHSGGIPASDGDILALSERKTGSIRFYRFDGQKITPIPGRSYRLPFTVTGRVVFYRGRAYIPAGASGIYCENEKLGLSHENQKENGVKMPKNNERK